ncbi:LysR family transcriptional regulator [Mycolicibacterium madagascariense]|uniref:LysR family transcriptional regulator n=1 Tax=Mycolicibacterium madagascariense TaxID=212765 RepID=UPI0013D0A2EC|nr:LysR family transcriptional regulator [Mycolicibacterium madagascariense]MCV7015503.1 LysR family transcriptional regulator [Mycolicibacterium madagascariense]
MELRALEYFVAVAEEESFTRAAVRCHVTQPSISQQIQSLERELGEQLFERLPRGIRLSPGGRVLLEHAKRALEAAAEAKSEFSARAGLVTGELNLGTVSGVERTVVPVVLGELHARFPGVKVTLAEDTSAPLLNLVLQGRLDAAVIARPLDELPAQVGSATLLSDRLMAVFDDERFSFDGPTIPLLALDGVPVISYAPSSGLRPILQCAFESGGLALHVDYAVNDTRLQVALARQGVGVAVCAGSDPALLDATDLVARPLEPEVRYDKILVWRTDQTPRAALRAFLRLWSDAFVDGRGQSNGAGRSEIPRQ